LYQYPKPLNEKKERLTPEQLDANYNKFMKGQELNNNGKELFEKVIKNAAKPHGSKL
jgi:hypothetical protein